MAGTRWIKGLSKKILKSIRPGDIVLLHDVRPHQPTLLAYWLNEIEFIISGIKGKGLAVFAAGRNDRPAGDDNKY